MSGKVHDSTVNLLHWRQEQLLPTKLTNLPVSRWSRYVVIFQMNVFNIQAVTKKGKEKQKQQQHERLSSPAQNYLKNCHFGESSPNDPDLKCGLAIKLW